MNGRWEGVATSYIAVAGKERLDWSQQNLPGRSQRDDDEAKLIDTEASTAATNVYCKVI
jgi:hypothetical protein